MSQTTEKTETQSAEKPGIEQIEELKRVECQICAPVQQQPKWVRDYCATRPESVAWAHEVAQKYRSKNPIRTQDDFWVSAQEVMKQYPSLHADELILGIFLRKV